jgi:hypothetical protein
VTPRSFVEREPLIYHAQENEISLTFHSYTDEVPHWPQWGYSLDPGWSSNWFVWSTRYRDQVYQVIVHHGKSIVECALVEQLPDSNPFVAPANLRKHVVLERGNAHAGSSLSMAMNYMRNLPHWRRQHLLGATVEALT